MLNILKKIKQVIESCNLFMKKQNSYLILAFLVVEIFLVCGITLIVKTLNYGYYTQEKFINKTQSVLRKEAIKKDVVEIVEEGGKRFNKLLTTLDIAQNSFALVINSDKKIKMYNKTKAEYSEELSLDLFPKIKNISRLNELISKHESGYFEYYSNDSKETLLCFVQAIPNSKWSLVVTVLKESIVMKTIKEKRYFFLGIACCIISITFTIAFLGWIFPKNIKHKFWYSTSLYSILLAVGVSSLCVFSNTHNDYKNPDEVSLTDQNIIDGYLDKYDNQLIEKGGRGTNRVKAGIFIKNIDFESSTKAIYTGYLWQKLEKDQIGIIKEGFYFSDSYKSELEKLYEKDGSDGAKTYVWYFKCILNNHLPEKNLYPFDVEEIKVRLSSIDFGNNVILVPDTRDYVDIEPYAKPGVYKELSLPGWNVSESFFTYLKEEFDSTFGVFSSNTGSVYHTELFYNIILRRSFLGAFISIFLPIFVTLVMVFILLLTCSNDEVRSKKLGFSAGGILASTAALFFVVIVAQIDLRDKVAADGLIYMDIYYFVTYLSFMIANVDSILICWPDKFKWIAWEDNIIVKSIFWPIVTSIVFISTLYYYFPR